jgi:hypothetical protein
MDWSRTETVALAKNSCTLCHGLGLQLGRGGKMNPCTCVLRAIFRACYARFRHCVGKEKYMSKISLELISGRERSFSWGRKDEEYIADFVLVSRRTLPEFEYKVFNYHFLLGADWRLCCRRLAVDRGTFFHAVYRIEENLGRIFRELEPYGLFPLDEYFHGAVRAEPVQNRRATMAIPIGPARAWRGLRPVLLRSA